MQAPAKPQLAAAGACRGACTNRSHDHYHGHAEFLNLEARLHALCQSAQIWPALPVSGGRPGPVNAQVRPARQPASQPAKCSPTTGAVGPKQDPVLRLPAALTAAAKQSKRDLQLVGDCPIKQKQYPTSSDSARSADSDWMHTSEFPPCCEPRCPSAPVRPMEPHRSWRQNGLISPPERSAPRQRGCLSLSGSPARPLLACLFVHALSSVLHAPAAHAHSCRWQISTQ